MFRVYSSLPSKINRKCVMSTLNLVSRSVFVVQFAYDLRFTPVLLLLYCPVFISSAFSRSGRSDYSGAPTPWASLPGCCSSFSRKRQLSFVFIQFTGVVETRRSIPTTWERLLSSEDRSISRILLKYYSHMRVAITSAHVSQIR